MPAMDRRRWLSHALFFVLLAAYALAYRTTLETLVEVWAGDGTFQYAFLIVPISVFLIWGRRRAVSACDFAPSIAGLLLVATWALLWLAGELMGVQLLQHFAVVALPSSLVLAVYGTAVARALLFPLLYSFFAFPWPVAGLTALLQQITAEFSVRVLQLTGFTTLLQGVVIETPFGAWHVAEACSGVKFFIASLALGALYANLFYRSWRRRLVFMLFAFVVPIVANGFRVYFTVVIGEVFGVQYATGTDHLVFGWQFFGTVLLLLFGVGWFWREAPRAVGADSSPAGRGGARPVSVGLLGLALLLAGPLTGRVLAALAPVQADEPAFAAAAVGSWHLWLPGANPLGASYRAPDALFMGTYADGRKHVNVVRVRYDGRPRYGHKLFLTGNRPYDSSQWWPLGSGQWHRPAGLHAVRQMRLDAGGQRRLVWYWYEVGGRVARTLPEIKFLQFWDGLRLAPLSTQIVILSTPLLPNDRDGAGAAAVLRAFMTAYAATGSRRAAGAGG